MSKTDPLEPGHIHGQNPNTPERLQGEMQVGGTSRLPLYAAVVAAVFLAAAAVVAAI